MRHWPLWFAVTAPLPIAFLLYSESLGFDYVWDEYVYIVKEGALASWAQSWQAAFSPYLQGSLVYFRPLPILTWAMDVHLGRGASTAHAVNVLLHGLNACLAATLAACLVNRSGINIIKSALAGVLAGLLYVSHPALIQTVAWVACRFDLLLCLFVTTFFLIDLTVRKQVLRPLALGLAFFLAALSKETAIVLPLLYLFWQRAFPQTDRQLGSPLWMDWAALSAAGLAYLTLRGYALHEATWTQVDAPELLQHMALMLKTLGSYVSLTLLPFFSLNPLHPFVEPLLWSDPQVLLGLATAVAAVFALLFHHKLSPQWILMACAIIALLPALNILRFNSRDLIQERFLTMPLIFMSLAAGGSLASFSYQHRAKLGGLCLALTAWILLCILAKNSYLPVWRNNVDLWTYVLKRHPDSVTAQEFLMNSLIDRGQSAAAIQLAVELEALQSGRLAPGVRSRFAYALSAEGRNEEGLQQITLQLQTLSVSGTDSERARLCADAGWMALASGQLPVAKTLLTGALRLGHNNPETEFNLGIVWGAMDDSVQSAIQIDNALKVLRADEADRWRQRAQQLIPAARELYHQRQASASTTEPHALLQACNSSNAAMK